MEPRTKKIVMGCGIGCGAVVLGVVVAIISFVVWLRTPGELLEPMGLIGDDTIGYAEWTLSLEDPGTERFVEDLIDTVQELQQAGAVLLPGPLESLALWKQERDRRKLRELFPMVVAWTLSGGPEPEGRRHLLSASLEQVGNRIVFTDWMMGLTVPTGRGPLKKISHLDEKIYMAPGSSFPGAFFMRGNDLFFTYDLDTAKEAVERLQPHAREGRPPSRIDELLARIPEGRSLRSALTNDGGAIYTMWERLALPAGDAEQLRRSAEELRAAVISGDLREDGTFAGEVELQAPDGYRARGFSEEALTWFREGLAYDGVELEADARVENDWIIIRFRVVGARNLLKRLLVGALPGAAGGFPDDATR